MRLQISEGSSHPLGPSVVKTEKHANGYEYQTVNIALLVRVPNVSICLFAPLDESDESVIRDIVERIPLTASTGAVRHVQLCGVPRGSSYAIHVGDGNGKSRLLTDPYAPCVESNGVNSWMRVTGENYYIKDNNYNSRKKCIGGNSRNVRDYIRSFTTLRALGIGHPFRPARFELPKDALEFKWTTNCTNSSSTSSETKKSFANAILYEAHARALALDGTLESAAKRAPYLRWLGVTAIQLLPIFEFSETDVSATGGEEYILNYFSAKNHKALAPISPSLRRGNHWGYAPLSFFAPMNRYSKQRIAGGPLALKMFVNAMHQHGIQVILDVVYNHTADSSCAFHFLNVQQDYYLEAYPQLQSRDSDNYGVTLNTKKFSGHSNLSACGNTLSANAQYTMRLIIDSMRHFVVEYHIDGFRLDAAGILCRDERGEPTKDPTIIQRIAHDTILRDAILIVEGWDAGDQIGSPNMLLGHFPYGERFREWNPAWRDAVRKFIRGRGENDSPELMMTTAGNFRAALCGHSDLFAGRPDGAAHGVNFVSCHDGLCLADIVSYSHRVNDDGYDGEISFNCGHEGLASTAVASPLTLMVEKTRCRQMRNLLTALAVSRGVPMIMQGDELGFSKQGNSNSWNCPKTFMCSLPDLPAASDAHENLVQFASSLFHLRKRHPQLTGVDFYNNMTWVDSQGFPLHKQKISVKTAKNLAHVKPDLSVSDSSNSESLVNTAVEQDKGNHSKVDGSIPSSASDYFKPAKKGTSFEFENAHFVAFITPSLHSLASAVIPSDAVYVAFNNSDEDREITLPCIPLDREACWTLEIDTHLSAQMDHHHRDEVNIDNSLIPSSQVENVLFHAQSALIYSTKGISRH